MERDWDFTFSMERSLVTKSCVMHWELAQPKKAAPILILLQEHLSPAKFPAKPLTRIIPQNEQSTLCDLSMAQPFVPYISSSPPSNNLTISRGISGRQNPIPCLGMEEDAEDALLCRVPPPLFVGCKFMWSWCCSLNSFAASQDIQDTSVSIPEELAEVLN